MAGSGLGIAGCRLLTSANGRVSRWRAPIARPKLAALLELGGTVAGAYLLRRGLFMPAELGGLLDAETFREGLAEFAPVETVAAALCPGPQTDFARLATLESTLYM